MEKVNYDFREIMDNLNYACNLKESCGVASNRYKKVFGGLTNMAIKAREKGLMNNQSFVDFCEMMPNGNEFTNEHAFDYADIKYEQQLVVNDMEVSRLQDEDYIPTIKAA